LPDLWKPRRTWTQVVGNAMGYCIVKKKIFSEVAIGKYCQRGWVVNVFWYYRKE